MAAPGPAPGTGSPVAGAGSPATGRDMLAPKRRGTGAAPTVPGASPPAASGSRPIRWGRAPGRRFRTCRSPGEGDQRAIRRMGVRAHPTPLREEAGRQVGNARPARAARRAESPGLVSGGPTLTTPSRTRRRRALPAASHPRLCVDAVPGDGARVRRGGLLPASPVARPLP
ncbi:hypothetical protein Sgou_15690 [Streptomyces gougerotii]|uniref:Uncharacterized protein n=1 Tax=Streptomyces gougerotii TaxID=53448 RepID=A0ABQ1D396_9ACTN|nr:hypothetical protein Sgou_15690 [Streptomyces gougerotii]